MSTAPEPGPQSARRREWLLRAAFEATLILLGLLGAFALDEWQDARSRMARVEGLLSAIRAELEANLARHAEASAFNVEVAERIYIEGTKGAEFVPDSFYPNGLFRSPNLTSAAWTTAQSDSVFSELPIEKALMLARVYERQRIYVDDFNTLANNMYSSILASDNGVFRADALGAPLRIGGILRDYARRGAQLVDLYREALEQL